MQTLASRDELIAVLTRVAKRDRDAFEILYRATGPKLLGIIIRILGRRDIAEEVLQEVYVKIWDRATDYNASVASPITWMATIARNRALDEARRRSTLSLEETPAAMDAAGDTPDPLADRERGEELARLEACLSKLEPERAELIRLAYLTGMSRDALAQRFDHPVSTIKTWLRRSLAQLKDCLGR